MKILFFVRSLELGGSQRQLAALAAGLAKRGHDVAVALFYGGGPNEEAFAGTSVRVIELEKAGRWHLFRPLIRLWRVIRAERPDILYAFLPTQTTLAALLAPMRMRVVFGVRAAGMQANRYDFLSALVYRLETWLSRRADLIIANAMAGRTDAADRGMPAERISVIPNGIDTERIKPDADARQVYRGMWNISDDSFVIGLVARLDPMKDHTTFLMAAAQYKRLDPHVRFVCVGNGPHDHYCEKMKALARSLGLASEVVWADGISDASAVYNAFDIATLSSAFGEAFPNAIGEAMACGVPVVATDLGDIASIVGSSGKIVPAGQPDQLCTGWARLRQRLTEEPNLRTVARQIIVENYGVEAMVGKTEVILAKLCANQTAAKVAGESR
jgi:glycosyltransferase involved in cell wall biosynthesis